MLLADDEHSWFTALQQIVAAAHRWTGEPEQRNSTVLLRLANDADAQVGRAPRELVDKSEQLVLAGEVALACFECRSRYVDRWIGIARGNGRRFRVFLRWIV